MDDDEEADSGLLNISISDSEEDDAAAACSQPQANGKTSEGRTGQSEAGFQAVKASYRPKLDNGHVRLIPWARPLLGEDRCANRAL